MAVRAIVLKNEDSFKSGNANEFLVMSVIYFDSATAEGDRDTRLITVPILWTDTLNTMKTKITAAIVNEGLPQYPTLTGSDVILLSYQKG